MQNLKKEIFTIAGGNSTALVHNCSSDAFSVTAQELLNDVEQVGFVLKRDLTYLKMMGDELCVNGILALAYSENSSEGSISASGVKHPIQYKNTENGTHITLKLPYTQKNNIILFESIGFICMDTTSVLLKKDLEALSKKYNLPAFGLIVYKGQNIYPTVYVRKTDSYIQETACGSGSIAAYLVTGLKSIVQPTGETIYVEQISDAFSIQARVLRV